MTTKLSILAACAAAVFGSASAVAAPVTVDLNFDNLVPANAQLPVPVSTLSGFLFSGAFGYSDNLIGDLGTIDGPNNASSGGYLINANGGAIPIVPADIEIEVGPNAGGGGGTRYLLQIKFDSFTTATAPVIYKCNANGCSQGLPLSPGQNSNWVPGQMFSFDATEQIDRVIFSAGNAIIGMDNLSLTLSDPTVVPNPTPEPASLALVGLGLAAALGSRRRRAA